MPLWQSVAILRDPGLKRAAGKVAGWERRTNAVTVGNTMKHDRGNGTCHFGTLRAQASTRPSPICIPSLALSHLHYNPRPVEVVLTYEYDHAIDFSTIEGRLCALVSGPRDNKAPVTSVPQLWLRVDLALIPAPFSDKTGVQRRVMPLHRMQHPFLSVLIGGTY